MTNHYLAITIGPIYRTMSLARKTREFWGASIIFSILAQKICNNLRKKGIKEDQFLVPNPSILNYEIKDVGLFLDRIICKCSPVIFEHLEEDIINESYKNLLEEIKAIPNADLTLNEIKNYFKIFAVYKPTSDNTPLADLSDNLNTLELYNQTSSDAHVETKLKRLLGNVNTEYLLDDSVDTNSFLSKYYSVPDFNQNIRIPSIVEIATVELFNTNPKEYKYIANRTLWKPKPDEKPFFPEIKNTFKSSLKNYHKYYCIIQADGDKLGKMLLAVNQTDIASISKDLIEWGKNALIALKEYGALPIYIGGDDLLCFAPVNNGNQSIVNLAHQLNSSYNQMPNLRGKSTLSISVQISYHKSPMYEAYKGTFDMLKKAKKISNACCINLEKHSGQPHSFIFSFDHEFSDYVLPLVQNMETNDKAKHFLNSAIYEINKNQEVLFEIRKSKERIWYFFENNFEEARLKNAQTSVYKFLKKLSDYIYYLYGIPENEVKDTASKMFVATVKLYSLLKTIRFIKGLDDDK